jgi:hypothetical protein
MNEVNETIPKPVRDRVVRYKMKCKTSTGAFKVLSTQILLRIILDCTMLNEAAIAGSKHDPH